MRMIRFTVEATLNQRPFAGEVTFSGGKSYTYVWLGTGEPTFIRWHGPRLTAEHRFAAPRRTHSLLPALLAWQPRPILPAAPDVPRAASGGGRIFRPTFERTITRGRTNTMPLWLPERSRKLAAQEQAAVQAFLAQRQAA